MSNEKAKLRGPRAKEKCNNFNEVVKVFRVVPISLTFSLSPMLTSALNHSLEVTDSQEQNQRVYEFNQSKRNNLQLKTSFQIHQKVTNSLKYSTVLFIRIIKLNNIQHNQVTKMTITL